MNSVNSVNSVTSNKLNPEKETMEERRKRAAKLGISVNKLYHLEQDRELDKMLGECHPRFLPKKIAAQKVLQGDASHLISSKYRGKERVALRGAQSDTYIGEIYKGNKDEEHTTMNYF